MKKFATLAAAGTLLVCNIALAGPADYVYTPAVEYGEKEIDFKYGNWKGGATDPLTDSSIGFGYGATPWWFTEFYLKFHKPNGESLKYDAVEWENKFQLTETGKYPVDVGFILEVERPGDHAEGWEVRYGPLFQTEFGQFQLNGNMIMARNYQAETSSAPVMQYQWQAKYRWTEAFEFGLQGFGTLGKWDHWASADAQSHQVGPAIFGKIPLGGREAIKYNAAWLVGTSAAAPDRNFRLQVEYEF
jgi:hypothetical protein